jgi:hypothetical protein
MRIRTLAEDRVSTFVRPGRAGHAKLAIDATAEDDLLALADRGGHESDEILEYEQAVVPKPMTLNNGAAALFGGDSVYDARQASTDARQAALPSTKRVPNRPGKIQQR